MPVPGAGRQGLVSFRLLGFPVSIHASFLLIVGFFGFSTGWGAEFAAVWLVVVTVSVIAHELGHALVAAPCGGHPRIDLYGMAGLTTWQPGGASRGRRVAVSIAGPAAGLALGLLVLAIDYAVKPAYGTLLARAFDAAVFANVFWGLLNLLPILPLDGGQVVGALMPGDPRVRLRRTAFLSIGVAVVVATAAFAAREPIAGLFVVYFAMGNVQTIRALKHAETGSPFAQRLNAAEEAVANGRPDEALRELPEPENAPAEWRPGVTLLRSMALLRLGSAAEAQALLVDHMPEGVRIDPTYEAAVLLANGQERLARERLAESLRAKPPEWAVRELVALLLARGDDVDATLGDVTAEAAAGAHQAFAAAERWDDAARWGERALAGGILSMPVAYSTACAWSRAGDAARAVRALDAAADLGFRDLRMAETDPDLATARTSPAWEATALRIAGLGTTQWRG